MYLLVARTKKDVCFPIRLQISICVLSLQRYSHLKTNLRFPVIQIVKRNSFLQPFISKAAVPILLLRFAMIDRLFSFLNPIIPFWNHSITMRNCWGKKGLVFSYNSFEAHNPNNGNSDSKQTSAYYTPQETVLLKLGINRCVTLYSITFCVRPIIIAMVPNLLR